MVSLAGLKNALFHFEAAALLRKQKVGV